METRGHLDGKAIHASDISCLDIHLTMILEDINSHDWRYSHVSLGQLGESFRYSFECGFIQLDTLAEIFFSQNCDIHCDCLIFSIGMDKDPGHTRLKWTSLHCSR